MKKFLASILIILSGQALAIDIDFQGGDVRHFAEWYASEIDVDLIIQPGVTGTITAFATGLSDDQLSDYVLSALHAGGFDLLGDDPLELVYKSDDALVEALQLDAGFMSELAVIDPVPLEADVFGFDRVRASDISPLVSSFLSAKSNDPSSVQVINASNSLLVTATAEALLELDEIIQYLDIEHPQVFIQAAIFEIQDTDSFDLGVAVGSRDPVALGSNQAVSGGYNLSRLTQMLRAQGGTFGIFNDDVLNFAVSALERNSLANLLSTPQIVTLSGQQGRVIVGENVPIITGRVTGESADITSPFQTIERRDVGVQLFVKPTVLNSGSIVMDVATSADSISDSVVASDVIFNQRSINTSVQLQDGQTVLLGGLVSEDTVETVSGVPLLKDIPFVGALFRSKSTSSDRRRLYVLLKAQRVMPL